MAWLSWAWRYKGTVGFIAITAALMFYVYLAKTRGADNAELRKQIKDYKAAIADQSAWHDETVAALEQKAEEDIERFAFEANLLRSFSKSDDGPLAPVLRNTLNSLHLRYETRHPAQDP